jgi:hypothetical protein
MVWAGRVVYDYQRVRTEYSSVVKVRCRGTAPWKGQVYMNGSQLLCQSEKSVGIKQGGDVQSTGGHSMVLQIDELAVRRAIQKVHT